MWYLEEAVRGEFRHRASAQRDPAVDSRRGHPGFRTIVRAQDGELTWAPQVTTLLQRLVEVLEIVAS